MRLTPRDIRLIHAVHRYRVLRRNQVQRLLFPSKNTANERLKLLYQHGYLARRRLPVEYGQGSAQALYMLATRGATLVAEELGLDLAEIDWRRTHNHVSSPFLEHTLMINDVRLAVELASQSQGYAVETWLREEELKARTDRIWIQGEARKKRRVTLIPDAYFRLTWRQKRASFYLEADRGTETNGRWAQKVQAYLAYVQSGAYLRRYGSNCLRVLVVTPGERRMANLLRATSRACAVDAQRLFWFTTLERIKPETVLDAPIWQVAGEDAMMRLMAPERKTEPVAMGEPRAIYAT